MIRVVRVLIILRVAGITIRRRPREFAVDMALQARNVYVGSGQWKAGEPRVIEGRARPARGAVADRAIPRETGLDVVGVRRSVVVLHVAAVAICRGSLEAPSNVTRGAFKRRVHPRQSKTREFQVIELCSEPCIRRMARFASGRESRSLVVRFGGLLIVGGVAGKAGSGEAGELADCFPFMAVRALQ